LTNYFGNKPKKVEMLDKDKKKVIKKFNSLAEAGAYMKDMNAKVYISNCCNGKQKHALGYSWRFAK